VLCDLRTRCWLWQTDGAYQWYGAFYLNGRTEKAHRIAWFLATGEWPERHVLHTCDVPACVNPGHLYLGGPPENTRDKLLRRRNNPPIGERARHAKLTALDIPVIRARRAAGETFRAIAADYPIGLSAVQAIVSRQSWMHVP
jgi:hypothetical protein